MNLIQNYLFVPANRARFLEKSLKLEGVGVRILDFEDSVSGNDIENALQTVTKSKVQSTDWIRIPVTDQFQEMAIKLFDLGLTKVVVPKVRDKEHFDSVMHQLVGLNEGVKVIVLVENAMIYIQLEGILNKWHHKMEGIGLGSHDFSADTNIRHNTKELFPIRLQICLLAKAFGVTPIDIASMNISDEKSYQAEIQSAYDLGYRAKFVLHPFQLQLLNAYPFFTKEEVDDAIEVLRLFEEKDAVREVVVKYKGKIYEKPHIENLKNIKQWGKQYYGTDR